MTAIETDPTIMFSPVAVHIDRNSRRPYTILDGHVAYRANAINDLVANGVVVPMAVHEALLALREADAALRLEVGSCTPDRCAELTLAVDRAHEQLVTLLTPEGL